MVPKSLLKALTVALLSLVACTKTQAQFPTAASYPFYATNDPFTYLSGGTPINWSSVNLGNNDDNYLDNVPIGFPFTFCGVTYTKITAFTNGLISLGGTTGASSYYYYPANTAYLQYVKPCVMAEWADLIGDAGSSTTYTTLGTSPNRIFVLEFKNWTNWVSSGNPPTYISFQFKLYEGGPIEVHYQREPGTAGFNTSAAVGIVNSQTDYQTLSNTSASPISSSVTFNNTTLAGSKPVSGQRYIWGVIPCTGQPVFNLTGPKKICPGRSFSISASGASIVSGLTYLWQSSNDSISWSNFTGLGYNTAAITDSIIDTKFYRCKITCTNSNVSYTTPAWRVNIAGFYYCYCLSNTTSPVNSGLDIGNVTVINKSNGIPLMNQGNPLPALNNSTAGKVYTDYTDSVSPPIKLYRDSLYSFKVTQVNSGPSVVSGTAAVFLDWNRDGSYDTVTERIVQKDITSADQSTEDTFTIPSDAQIGLTGMRVIIQKGSPVLPCGNYGEGETEDYIVNLSYEPCKGAVNGGKVEGDTSVCWGYDYIVTDTTYEKRKSGFTRNWQVSGDNKLWFDVAGSNDKDTLMRTFVPAQPLYYRNRLICMGTLDTSYSQVLTLNIKAGYKCYCYSQAIGGRSLDTSDIGGFSLASVVNNDGGTHLMNAKATHKRTDHTDEVPIEISADSLYQMTVFHTMSSAVHADAKVTVFMDFNNNNNYDLPEDLVYLGYTSIGTFTLVDKVKVKPMAIYDVPTGMRVILNNDIAPNAPSDQGCGVFTSGETEDYMIIFRKNGTKVNTIDGISDLSIYPNPANGKFTLSFNTGKNIKNVELNITNMTGQLVMAQHYEASGKGFSKVIDLENQPKGVYFVELRSEVQRMITKLAIE